MAVVPVITHNEKVAIGHRDIPEFGPGGRMGRFSMLIGINAMLVAVRLPIDVNFSATYLDLIAGQGYDALDEILALILWKNKHDHIITLGRADGDKRPTCERNFDTVYEFINEDMIANQ